MTTQDAALPRLSNPLKSTSARGANRGALLVGSAARPGHPPPLGEVGLVIVLAMIAVALLAPTLATHPPNMVLIGKEEGVKRRQPPCIHAVDNLPSLPIVDFFRCEPGQPEHYFGTDGNARDLYSRVLFGVRCVAQGLASTRSRWRFSSAWCWAWSRATSGRLPTTP